MEAGATERQIFVALLIGFGAQIAGRLVDLQWHVTHDEFEGAAEQVQAHWLIWLSTVFVLGVAAVGLRTVRDHWQRRGYAVVLLANATYAVVSVIHFFQHLDHREVDWAHLLLAVTSAAAGIGVLWVIGARFTSRGKREEILT